MKKVGTIMASIAVCYGASCMNELGTTHYSLNENRNAHNSVNLMREVRNANAHHYQQTLASYDKRLNDRNNSKSRYARKSYSKHISSSRQNYNFGN